MLYAIDKISRCRINHRHILIVVLLCGESSLAICVSVFDLLCAPIDKGCDNFAKLRMVDEGASLRIMCAIATYPKMYYLQK